MKSPFKFLNAYAQADKDIFFGREEETEELYDRVFETNLILLYGASGTGKTSIINCGLANKFESADWHPIFIRRKGDLLQSLNEALDQAALTKIPNDTIFNKAKSLYLDYFKPVYLIFDQFEELFVLGTQEEQIAFFDIIRTLLNEGLQCKILISMREEYIAYLSDYELIIPNLFDNRQRIEKMNMAQIKDVIEGTTTAFNIALEPREMVLDAIIHKLRDPKQGIELSSLQVYLDSIYRKARELQPTAERLTFTPDLITQTGAFEDVLDTFLSEQIAMIEQELEAQGNTVKGVPQTVLFALVTEDGTKQALETKALEEQLFNRKKILPKHIAYCVKRFQELRIIQEVG
jgi:hypothetical protein